MSKDKGPKNLGLDLYFLNDVEEELLDKIEQNVASFQSHIQRHEHLYPFSQIEKDRFFTIDYKVLISDEQFLSDWEDFKQDLVGNTEFSFNCLGLAMHDLISKIRRESQGAEGLVKRVPLIRARICNYEPVVQLREVNVSCFGKFISLRGTVVKASAVKIICNYMAFYCPCCQGSHVIKQNSGAYTPMEKCLTPGCRAKGNFETQHNSPLTKTVNWQSVVVQETDCDMAKIPQTLECELTEDLVKSCMPGDEITISGIVKVRDPNDNKGKNKQNAVFNLYLSTVSVYNNRNESCGGGYSASCERIKFTEEDYQAIKQIHAQPNLFRYLVHSLCPTIYGHEIVKAGLLLGLFRGTKSHTSRSESHVLMVGDPGLGKSQMLKSCANVSPRGVYVCGNVSTTSGLTVTMTREAGGEYCLEAGALMLADQGCCCIDEFDKMPMQHACLLEAMEQQSISIAKAGVVCSLPTKPTILVAANPAGGHYNKAKTVAENLKIGSPMLSRFDLIFILLDQPNEHLDKYLSKHILSAHSSKKRQYTPKEFEDDEDESNGTQYKLRDRLKLNGESIDPLPHKVFRKYIAYAQKYVNPQLSQEAKSVLKEFYVSLRRQFATGDCTPVTARQLHSLIRLTQARAKAELREEATEDDARDVIEIMKNSLIDVFTNESGLLDTTRSPMGSGMSHKNQVMKLLDLLQRKSEMESKSLFTVQEIKEACESAGILKTKFTSALQSLNIQGFLLSKGRNMYQLNSAYL